MARAKGFAHNLKWIFIGDLAHAVFQFLLGVLAARVFGAQEFGLINYGASLVTIFASVGTLGLTSVVTKFFADDEPRAGVYLGTGILARLVTAVVSMALLQGILLVSHQDSAEMKLVVFLQSLQLVFLSGDLLIYWFRYKEEAKTVAIYRLIAFFVTASLRGVALLLGSVHLYVLGISLETGALMLTLLVILRKSDAALRFGWDKQAFFKMFKASYPFIFSVLLVTVYGQTDKIMLENMLSDEAVGLYSVSQQLAGAIVIIPSALIEGFRPDIMAASSTDRNRYRQRLQQLYGLVFWLCMAYCLFITVFAGPLIHILYGDAYAAAKPALSLIVWYTSFSYFGAINNLYMVAENKTFWVQIVTLVGALANVALNALTIPTMGIVGAALASLVTQFLANFVLLLVIPPLRDDFKIILEGITFRGFKDTNVIQLFKGILKRGGKENV